MFAAPRVAGSVKSARSGSLAQSRFHAISGSSQHGSYTPPETEEGLGYLDIVIPPRTLEGSAGSTSSWTCEDQTDKDGDGYQGFDRRKEVDIYENHSQC